jgi:hypothetical protein
VLADALHRTGIHGVLCTLNKSQDLNAGHLFGTASRPAGWGDDPQNPATDFRDPEEAKLKRCAVATNSGQIARGSGATEQNERTGKATSKERSSCKTVLAVLKPEKRRADGASFVN